MKPYENIDSRFGLNLSIINRAAQSYFYHNLKKFNIGPGQQAYLLSIFPGEQIVQEEIVNRLKVDRANVTRALKGLEMQGYIKRQRSQDDKRSIFVSLTKKGIHIRSEIETISIQWINKLKAPLLNNEWILLEQMLQTIVLSLES